MTKTGDVKAATETLERSLAEINARHQEQVASFKRSQITLLSAAMQQDILRHDSIAVARRVEAMAPIGQPESRPAYTARFLD
jgi:hypothetical protein